MCQPPNSTLLCPSPDTHNSSVWRRHCPICTPSILCCDRLRHASGKYKVTCTSCCDPDMLCTHGNFRWRCRQDNCDCRCLCERNCEHLWDCYDCWNERNLGPSIERWFSSNFLRREHITDGHEQKHMQTADTKFLPAARYSVHAFANRRLAEEVIRDNEMRPGTGHRGDATHVHKGIFSFAFEENPRTSPGVLQYVRERAIGAFAYTQHDDVYISIWDNLNHPSYIQAVSDSLAFDWRMMHNHERVIVIHHSFGPLIPVEEVGTSNAADATFHALTNDLNLNEMPPPLPVQQSAPAQSNDTNSEETTSRSGRHIKKRKLD